MIDDAGFGEYFIHRTGHGIGMEAHEDPYMVEGNSLPLEAGHAFSVEPGIYIGKDYDKVPAAFRGIGVRIEDDILVTKDAPDNLTRAIPKTVAELRSASAQA